ncbi:hypothetical protein PIB30_003620 [Stylosanthes scabra]|uniref:Uncharacterized protein n=1 Tax=Stylosanthes scabra TaxID=79078 RepID=A0ABU6Y1W6_9FABA|nr:hypothetical protein [Stylosanthes scabra]
MIMSKKDPFRAKFWPNRQAVASASTTVRLVGSFQEAASKITPSASLIIAPALVSPTEVIAASKFILYLPDGGGSQEEKLKLPGGGGADATKPWDNIASSNSWNLYADRFSNSHGSTEIPLKTRLFLSNQILLRHSKNNPLFGFSIWSRRSLI